MSRPALPDLGRRGEGWVAAQVGLFAVIALAGSLGPAWSGTVRAATGVAGAVLLGAGGLFTLRGIIDLRENLTPFPRPLPGARLVDTGAYRLARHPIYGGAIIAALGWGLLTASLAAIGGAAVLAVFFDLKSRREEIWLADQFADYPAYRSRTRRLIPWVY